MAYWDSEQQKIVHFPPVQSIDYPKWEEIDCGCCAGIAWGGNYPNTCNYCEGTGRLFCHIKSGVLALYPGGPFKGKDPK